MRTQILGTEFVLPLSYKTLAVRSRSKSIAEKRFTVSGIFPRGFMSILETPVHTGRTLPPFFLLSRIYGGRGDG